MEFTDNTTRTDLLEFLESIARPGHSLSGISDDVNLIDEGFIDSLALVQIITYLEQDHSINLQRQGIDPNDLGSIAGILSAIDNNT